MAIRNALPISLFLTLFITNYLVKKAHLLPSAFIWLPELVIAIVAAVVISRVIANHNFKIPLKYILIFLGFVYVVITGIVLNVISSYTVISGIRTYFKYVPLFLLPLVYNYSEADIRKQFFVILLLGLMQLPVTLWQRFIEFRHLFTGDVITGTLGISNSLSIILICIILALITLYLKKILSLKIVFITSFLIFIPTTLNETKITPIFLAIGISALLFSLRKELSPKLIAFISISAVILLIGFGLVYDKLYKKDDGAGISELMTSEDRMLGNYNFTGFKADPNAVFKLENKFAGEFRNLPTLENALGRIDSFQIPIDVFIKHDVIKLFFGLGIGNITSKVGPGGAYLHVEAIGGSGTTLSQLIWETGVLGALLFVVFIIFIARDSYVLAKNNNYWGTIAIAWFAITMVILSSVGYNTIFHFDEIACLFIYFSGLIVFKRYQQNGIQQYNM